MFILAVTTVLGSSTSLLLYLLYLTICVVVLIGLTETLTISLFDNPWVWAAETVTICWETSPVMGS